MENDHFNAFAFDLFFEYMFRIKNFEINQASRVFVEPFPTPWKANQLILQITSYDCMISSVSG